MGIFNKKQEKEYLDIDTELDDGSGDYGPAGETKQEVSPDLQLNAPQENKDLEILNSKISALKSELELLKEKVRQLEQRIQPQEKPQENTGEKYGFSKPQESDWHY